MKEICGSRQTLDHTQAEDKITWLKSISKGELLHGLSAIPVTSIIQKIGKDIVQRVPTVSRHRTICERAREEKVQPGVFYNKVDKAVGVGLLCRTSHNVMPREHLYGQKESSFHIDFVRRTETNLVNSEEAATRPSLS